MVAASKNSCCVKDPIQAESRQDLKIAQKLRRAGYLYHNPKFQPEVGNIFWKRIIHSQNIVVVLPMKHHTNMVFHAKTIDDKR